MLKAKALCVVEDDREPDMTPLASTIRETKCMENHSELNSLIRDKQNLVIESANDIEIPKAVAKLAVKMMKNNKLIKDLLLEIRQMYIRGQKEFHLSLENKSEDDKHHIIELFNDMSGVISSVRYCSEYQSINGTLLFTPKAQSFLTGRYLEIAVYETARDVLEELSVQYHKEFDIYRNVRVRTYQGIPRNEFDIVFNFGGTFFVIECKSGKTFSDWESLVETGQTYGVVPDRLLLVDSFIEDERAECIEYFCGYYVSNVLDNSMAEKVRMMVEKSLK